MNRITLIVTAACTLLLLLPIYLGGRALAHEPSESTVYEDPQGRFSLPLIGDWTPVETDGSYGHYRLAEPILDLYVVTVESEDLDAVAEAAFTRIGLDPEALSQLAEVPAEHWTFSAYALESEQGVTLAARRLGGATAAIIISGNLGVTTAPPLETFMTLDAFSLMPLAEYLEFQPPPTPTTIEAIDNLNHIEFYSGNQPFIGHLILPDGEGPFPAVVYVHGSGPTTRHEFDFGIPTLQAAGIAVFSYDKRGVGDSEGVFVGTHNLNGSPSLSEWRLPQLADDALAAVTFLENLQEINPDQIGLIGWSQAGWIIPVAVTRSDVPAFTVIANGPTVTVGEAEFHQQLTGKPYNMPPMTESEREVLSEQLAAFDGPHGFDPREYIEAISIPGLWIWGDLDGWVPTRESRAILESIVAEHDKDFTIQYHMSYGHQGSDIVYINAAVDWILAHLDE